MLGQFPQQHQVLTTGTLVLWSLALAWVPVLLVCEAVRPRLRYDLRRWATVFPLGMYAACSFTVGQVAGISGISRFGQVETWVAVAATVAVLACLARQIWRARPLVVSESAPVAAARHDTSGPTGTTSPIRAEEPR